MVAYSCHPSTREAEAGWLAKASMRLCHITQLRLWSEILFKKKPNNNSNKANETFKISKRDWGRIEANRMCRAPNATLGQGQLYYESTGCIFCQHFNWFLLFSSCLHLVPWVIAYITPWSLSLGTNLCSLKCEMGTGPRVFPPLSWKSSLISKRSFIVVVFFLFLFWQVPTLLLRLA